MCLCQHSVTLTYVSPIETVIIGGAQFKHMLNIGRPTVSLFVCAKLRHKLLTTLVKTANTLHCVRKPVSSTKVPVPNKAHPLIRPGAPGSKTN